MINLAKGHNIYAYIAMLFIAQKDVALNCVKLLIGLLLNGQFLSAITQDVL